jgi:ABC-type Na+ transport system ATPase subunit NatA
MKKLLLVTVLVLSLAVSVMAGERNPKSDDSKFANGVMAVLNEASTLDSAYTEATVWIFDDGDIGLQMFASKELQDTLKKLNKEGRNSVAKKLLESKVEHMIKFASKAMDISNIGLFMITDEEGKIIAQAKR